MAPMTDLSKTVSETSLLTDGSSTYVRHPSCIHLNRHSPSSLILDVAYSRQQVRQNECAQRSLKISSMLTVSQHTSHIISVGVSSLARFLGGLAPGISVTTTFCGSPASRRTDGFASMYLSNKRSSFHRKCCSRMEAIGY